MVFAVLTLLWLAVYALAVGHASGWLRRPGVRKALDRFTGVVLIGFGVRLALERALSPFGPDVRPVLVCYKGSMRGRRIALALALLGSVVALAGCSVTKAVDPVAGAATKTEQRAARRWRSRRR